MRFPLAVLFFLASSFIFFIIWVVTTFILSTFYDALQPLGSGFSTADQASYNGMMSLLPTAFGIICALFFVVGIVLIFALESWSDEPEYYYRQQ